jgi:hypothetical protein
LVGLLQEIRLQLGGIIFIKAFLILPGFYPVPTVMAENIYSPGIFRYSAGKPLKNKLSEICGFLPAARSICSICPYLGDHVVSGGLFYPRIATCGLMGFFIIQNQVDYSESISGLTLKIHSIKSADNAVLCLGLETHEVEYPAREGLLWDEIGFESAHRACIEGRRLSL